MDISRVASEFPGPDMALACGLKGDKLGKPHVGEAIKKHKPDVCICKIKAGSTICFQ